MTTTAQQIFLGQIPEKAVPTASAEALGVSPGVVTTALIIRAPQANAGPVFIGKDNVTIVDGMPLYPGEVMTLNVRDPALVFCIAAVGGNVLRVMGV